MPEYKHNRGESTTRHIDPDLFELFPRSGIRRAYGERFLKLDQLDDVDRGAYL